VFFYDKTKKVDETIFQEIQKKSIFYEETVLRQKKAFEGEERNISEGSKFEGYQQSIRSSFLNYGSYQAWATSDPRATYGPPRILIWPASYI